MGSAAVAAGAGAGEPSTNCIGSMILRKLLGGSVPRQEGTKGEGGKPRLPERLFFTNPFHKGGKWRLLFWEDACADTSSTTTYSSFLPGNRKCSLSGGADPPQEVSSFARRKCCEVRLSFFQKGLRPTGAKL